MSPENARVVWDKILLTALMGLMGAALYQIVLNTSRITKIEEQIISIREMQTRQDFLHQREMDRMMNDLIQHRQATEKNF